MSGDQVSLPILSESLCQKCIALCCRYITVEIDKPTTKRQKDDVRWYLLHEGITIIIEKSRWHVKFPTKCTALQDDNSCGIYENRPATCREYSTDNCDYHSVFGDWEQDYIEIETVEEFDAYLESRKRKTNQTKAIKKAQASNGKAQKTKSKA